MVFVGENDPKARYVVSVWKERDSEERPSYFTSQTDAEEAFARLKRGGHFKYGAVGRWMGYDKASGLKRWDLIDSWPVDFQDQMM